ncbi:MAG: hypothetical protein K2L86_00935 [Lachnospiraceae bacterium]|nr:hypothetical protein [Lachnospiraceae bacterium]
MKDTATRFDNIVNTEEKKKRTNAFVKSNSTLKGASDKEDICTGNDITPIVDQESEEEKIYNVQNDEKSQAVKSEKGKKRLVLDKSGKLDLKSLINAKDGDSKSYSLYLKEKTYKKLEKLAKSQNVSVSRALNDILDSIL